MALDLNGDGGVTREELRAGSDRRIARLDTNRDDEITAEEIAARARFDDETSRQMARYLVRVADTDRNGSLSSDEWQSQTRERVFAFLDRDADGAVTGPEFASVRQSFAAKAKPLPASRPDHRDGTWGR
ncbi:EF-hand domain-containing protein [Pseudooceanicola sp. C21-150M6]